MTLDRLRFQCVMAGEYRCHIPGGGTYEIDRYMDGWTVHYKHSSNIRIRILYTRRLFDARIAATRHAVSNGFVVA